jgi:hypothetical protein
MAAPKDVWIVWRRQDLPTIAVGALTGSEKSFVIINEDVPKVPRTHL